MAGALSMPAPGAGDKVAELEVALLLEGLYQLHEADFRGFEKQVLRAKLQDFVLARELGSISALQARVFHDAVLAGELIRELHKVSAVLMDSPERLRALREVVMPLLRSEPWPRVWIADCSNSEPVIGLVILLEEEGLYERTQVFVTAPSADVLLELQQLRLSDSALARFEERYHDGSQVGSIRHSFKQCDGNFELIDSLRKNIVWGQHDLGSDASFNEFQLIICQRPLAEYGVALQRRVLRLFKESLSTFGVLQVGFTPSPATARLAANYSPISTGHGIYRRGQ